MFFDKELVSCDILDVIEVRQRNADHSNHGRNFSALSFRMHSNACLKTSDAEYRLCDNSVSYIPARLDYRRISDFDDMIVVHFNTYDYHTDDIEFFVSRNPDKLKELFRELLECWSKKELGYRYKCTALIYSVFAECYIQNFKPDFRDSKIRNSVKYISENYKDKNFTLGEAAVRSHISEVYFRKLFKAEYGISPKKYIINLRIQNAAGLISSGYYSLKEVADMSGYNDYKHFSTEFKKIMGVSPSDYLYNFPE